MLEPNRTVRLTVGALFNSKPTWRAYLPEAEDWKTTALLLTGLLILSLLLLAPALVVADDLTRIIQEDLTALGYDTGNTTGEMTTPTAIAISKFQAEHNLEVTGEPSPQLAGIVKATIKNGNTPGASREVAAVQPAVQDEAALRAAQQTCLQEKAAAAQASQKKKRGFGSLIRAVSRTATQLGGSDLSRAISETSYDIYNVNATAADLESAAKDLGLTGDDVEACRNPAPGGGQR